MIDQPLSEAGYAAATARMASLRSQNAQSESGRGRVTLRSRQRSRSRSSRRKSKSRRKPLSRKIEKTSPVTWDKVDTFPLGSKSVARNNWPTKDHVFRIYDVPPHAEIENDQEWLFSHPLDSQIFVPLIQSIQAFVGMEEDL